MASPAISKRVPIRSQIRWFKTFLDSHNRRLFQLVDTAKTSAAEAAASKLIGGAVLQTLIRAETDDGAPLTVTIACGGEVVSMSATDVEARALIADETYRDVWFGMVAHQAMTLLDRKGT